MTDPAPATASGEITSADPEDAHHVASVIAEAFQHLKVAHWLIPRPDDRRPVLEANMMIMVEHALAGYGTVDITSDKSGVAVWFHHDHEAPPEPLNYEERLAAACGEYTANFAHLDEKFAENHPHDMPHHHLAFMAVVPGEQRRGIGTALLKRHFDLYPGVASYLEASCEESRALYLRHGWRDLSEPFRLPDETPMWPMWRDPQP